MSINNTIKTNRQLRKLYRAAKTISKKAAVGTTVMCPCGCLEQFEKEEKNQIFSKSNSFHSDDFDVRIKSHLEEEFTEEMSKIHVVMNAYIQNYKVEITQAINEIDTEEKIKLSLIDNEATSKNFHSLILQNKAISRHAKVGSTILCSCGCDKRFSKHSKEQIFFKKECENVFNNLMDEKNEDGEQTIEMNEDRKTSFKIMNLFVTKAVKILLRAPELKDAINEAEKRKKRMHKATYV